jgi:hypothetical protein
MFIVAGFKDIEVKSTRSDWSIVNIKNMAEELDEADVHDVHDGGGSVDSWGEFPRPSEPACAIWHLGMAPLA